MKRMLIASLFAFAFLCPAVEGRLSAQETEDPKESVPWEEIRNVPRKLASLLGHDDWKVRKKAGTLLVALEDLAVPVLEEAKASEDREVALRSAQLLREIEERIKRKSLKLIIEAEKDLYKPGEPIRFSAKFRNTYREPLTVCNCVDGSSRAMRSPYYLFEVTRIVPGPAGKPIPTRFPKGCGNANVLTDRDLKELQPGEELQVSGWLPGEVSRFHDMREPGTYRIQLVYVFERSKSTPRMPCGMPPEGEALHRLNVLLKKALEGEIRSNAVTVHVKG